MPADCGRNPAKLAELSRRTGVHIVAPTGLHHERFYGAVALEHRARPRTSWPTCSSPTSRTGSTSSTTAARSSAGRDVRAGVVKVAGSDGGPSARDLPSSAAAAATHRRTGVPILTHCEAGTGALEQVRVLLDAGVPASARLAEPRRQGRRPRLPPRAPRDRRVRRLRPGRSAGATAPNGTLQLLEWAVEDGTHRPGRCSGWTPRARATTASYGGSPGLSYLLRELQRPCSRRAASTAAVRDRLFVGNPARAFAFARARSRGRRMSEALLTSVVGSHARPSWFASGDRRRGARRVRPGRPRRDARRRASTSRCATRRRPASTSSPTARCAGRASSPPSSTAT